MYNFARLFFIFHLNFKNHHQTFAFQVSTTDLYTTDFAKILNQKSDNEITSVFGEILARILVFCLNSIPIKNRVDYQT